MWLHPQKLILASGSQARRSLLEAAAIPVESVQPIVDERLIESRSGLVNSSELAVMLAEAKAKAICDHYSDRVLIASDQVLDFNGEIVHKKNSRRELIDQIQRLKGRSHTLHSGICIVRDGCLVESFYQSAVMNFRNMNRNTISDYATAAVDKGVLSSVGGYHFEDKGIDLFEKVQGHYSTIIGFPLFEIIRLFHKLKLFKL